jgi:hypothetical protein
VEIKFNWNIGIGDILTLCSALIVAGSLMFRGGQTLTKLQIAMENALAEIAELKKEVAQMGKVLTQLAVQEERLSMLTRWYDELRRGQGFVRGTHGIDREYGG